MDGFVDFGLALRERITQVLLILAAGMALSAVYISQLPREYTSQVQILVDPQIAQLGTPGGGDQSAVLRHQKLIEQNLLSDESLGRIILELSKERGATLRYHGERLTPEILREQLQILPVGGAREVWQPQTVPIALTVSARLDDPDLTLMMVNRIANEFVSADRNIRLTKAQARQTFHRNSADALAKRLAEVEARIGEFKVENAMALPSAIPSLRSTILELEDEITQIDRNRLKLEADDGATSSHRDRQRALKISELLAERRLLSTKRDELYAQLRLIPANERHLSELMRNRELLAAQVSSSFSRVAEADMKLDMEEAEWLAYMSADQFSEQTAVGTVEGREKAFLLCALLTVAAAAFYVVVTEMRRPTVRTAAQLEKALGLAPLVSIGHVQTSSERMVTRLTIGLLLLLTGLVVYSFQALL